MSRSEIQDGIAAGVLYAIGVFAIGFMLGAVRVMFLVPLLGPAIAVATELPIILTASWVLCGRTILVKHVPAKIRSRIAMGLSAFTTIMIGDLFVGLVIFGLSASDYVIRYSELVGLLGLAGQIMFAVFPLLRHRGNINC